MMIKRPETAGIAVILAMLAALVAMPAYADDDFFGNPPEQGAAMAGPEAPAPESSGLPMRLEGVLGTALGGGHVNDKNRHGDYEAKGGTAPGLALGARLWVDGVFDDPDFKPVSLGFEYGYNSLGATWKDTSNRDADADLSIHSFLFNAAYRLEKQGKITPYVGAGLGVAYYDVSVKETGATNLGSGTDGFAPIMQAFVGMDYDLGDGYYTGIEAKYGGFSTFGLGGPDAGYGKADMLIKFGVEF